MSHVVIRTLSFLIEVNRYFSDLFIWLLISKVLNEFSTIPTLINIDPESESYIWKILLLFNFNIAFLWLFNPINLLLPEGDKSMSSIETMKYWSKLINL